MTDRGLPWLILAVLLLAARPSLFAQDNATTSTLQTIRQLQGSMYPEFVSRSEARVVPEFELPAPAIDEAPDPNAPEEEPTPEAEIAPTPRPPVQVLVDDVASTTTWSATRTRIDKGLEDLRLAMLTRSPSGDVAAIFETIKGDFARMALMAPVQAPQQEQGLDFYRERIERQLSLMVRDYTDDRLDRLQNIDSMLRESMENYRELLFRSDLDRGARVERLDVLPPNWNHRPVRNRQFETEIVGWDAQRLLDEYRGRAADLEYALRRDRDVNYSVLTEEMGALAREAARRGYEVPIASQAAFRNASLRLDVLSQNVVDYLREGNEPHARRQLILCRRAADHVQDYLDLKKRGL